MPLDGPVGIFGVEIDSAIVEIVTERAEDHPDTTEVSAAHRACMVT